MVLPCVNMVSIMDDRPDNTAWDEALQSAYVIIEGEEKNKRKLWKISYEIKKEFGGIGLKEFADNLKETYGLNRSYNTLRQYAYIYEMTVDYDIPEDVPYTTIRAILAADVPLDYIRMIQGGASGAEVMRLLMVRKPSKRKVKCPICKRILPCPVCQEKIKPV